jgi:Spy/CpxP family protein refolding chaperone
MKKLQLLFAALLLAATTTAASAQDGPPRRGGGNRAAALLQGITLTAEQQAKVDTLSQKAMAEMQAIRADTTLAQDARRTKSGEIFNKQAEAIKALLTAEQKTVFEKNWTDVQARMQQQGGGRPPQG